MVEKTHLLTCFQLNGIIRNNQNVITKCYQSLVTSANCSELNAIILVDAIYFVRS